MNLRREMMGGQKILTAEECQKCLTYPSKTIETSLGPIEYADRGEGPVLLSAHGQPGGFDQGLGIGEVFRKAGFRIVAVSRPGYLGTPLEVGKTAEAQGDALSAFMDAMNLSKVAVVGCSAGGPPSYQLAERHPDRVAALIEIDSISMKFVINDNLELSKLQEALYFSKPGLWLIDYFIHHFPAAVVKNFMQTSISLDKHELGKRVKEIVGDEDKLAFVDFLFKTMSQDYDRRKAGVDNDFAIAEEIDKLPLSNIKCPTLIIHGDADTLPISHAEYAYEAIPGSDLFPIKGGSHIGFWVAPTALEAQEFAVKWLKEKMGV
jgi:pimeloyl-ACP methyl ester carboxylesterase